MNRQYVVAAVVAIGLIGTVGVGSALAGVGPAADLLEEEQHELLDFAVSDPQCTDAVSTNSSTSIQNAGEDTRITHAQNISLADASVSVGNPTFERLNESAYVLSVPTEETDELGAQCIAYARYEASMQIPVDDEPWTVIVEHDNETAMTLFGDSNSAAASGSASAGAQVSDEGT